jgi:hypothetical protein
MVLIFYFLLRNLLFLRNNVRHCQGSHWEYFIKPLSAASRIQKVFTLPGRPDIIKQFVMYELKMVHCYASNASHRHCARRASPLEASRCNRRIACGFSDFLARRHKTRWLRVRAIRSPNDELYRLSELQLKADQPTAKPGK